MAIYTKQGDNGKTSLISGRKVSKASLRVETYGTIDELNSILGLVVSKSSKDIKDELIKVQIDLFELGANLAGLGKSKEIKEKLEKRVLEIEKEIDKIEKKLPKLTNFILPGGSEVGSFLHMARTFCRRAERRAVSLSSKEKVEIENIKYLNRLSDYLFILARSVNLKAKKKETIWKSK